MQREVGTTEPFEACQPDWCIVSCMRAVTHGSCLLPATPMHGATVLYCGEL